MKILGISGSLRKDSFNTRMLLAAREVLPPDVELDIFSLNDIPLYNGDLDGEVKPESVVALKDAIREADGILFASPEYNYSMTGVLKNALDWASRPAYKSVLAGKPVAVLSVAKGHVGGGRSQSHLLQVFTATLSPVLPSPAFLVPLQKDTFDSSGDLADEAIRARLERYMGDFCAWIIRLDRGR